MSCTYDPDLPHPLYIKRDIGEDATARMGYVGSPTSFTTVSETMWYIIITITTVGYGDMQPDTTLGHLTAVAVTCAGIIILSLPITVISDAFVKELQEDTKRMAALTKQNEAAAALKTAEDPAKRVERRILHCLDAHTARLELRVADALQSSQAKLFGDVVSAVRMSMTEIDDATLERHYERSRFRERALSDASDDASHMSA